MAKEGADLGGIELQEKGQLSARAISKRQEMRKTNRFLAGTQIRGQYMKDPNYEVWCLGNSKRDVGIITFLFLCIWGFTTLYFIALKQFTLYAGNTALWTNFVIFVLFLGGIGVAVSAGQNARKKREEEFAKEHVLSQGV